MSVPPDSIQIGKSYLLETKSVRHVCLVTDLMAGSSVRFEWREASAPGGVFVWTNKATDLRSFANDILREVPCDWTPEKRWGWR